MKLVRVVHLEFELELVSGGRVAGGGGALEIGSPVEANLAIIKDPISGEPYIPGSSLKGKLRSIAEKVAGKIAGSGEPCGCGLLGCPICPLFGAHKKTRAESAPTRITVRDLPLTAESKEKWNQLKAESKDTLEYKTENTVSRTTGAADHPRTGERVPAGTTFKGHIIVHIHDRDEAKESEYVQTIANALKVLEEAEAIGAGGSRGYGEVAIKKPRRRTQEAGRLAVRFEEAGTGTEGQ